MMSRCVARRSLPRLSSIWWETTNAKRGSPLANAARSHSVNSSLINEGEPKANYDAIVIGAGHNGIVAAAYMQKAGLDVCILERRHVVGGAAVTEELVPGFKFSRASYVLSLLRPAIIKDLQLKKHGLKIYLRDPGSYTPLDPEQGSSRGRHRSLTLGMDNSRNKQQISQFSKKDAANFERYEDALRRMVSAVLPLLDKPPVDVNAWTQMGGWKEKQRNWPSMLALLKSGVNLGRDMAQFYELMTAPPSKVLDKWFESEPLKATLATDACIGAMTSPYIAGSGYVLLHHIMGELEGVPGAWGYVKGGMGAVSDAIGMAAKSQGASIFTNQVVDQIVVDNITNDVTGVVTSDGKEISAKYVLSNATPKVTFVDMIKEPVLPEDFLKDVSHIDYTSPVTKINVAVSRLPSFLATPSKDKPMPHHGCTVHLNCEHTDLIHRAFLDAQNGEYSKKPVIEMTIPSSLDPTLAPPGAHVVQLFTQYTPYKLSNGRSWTEELKEEYADSVFDDIERYAPGFKDSVIGRDILTPPDLERIFGLTGGNIFHGSMSLDQLFCARPLPSFSHYRSPLKGLYLCGSGAHPGGGVMGSVGQLAANTVLQDRIERMENNKLK